MTNKELLEYAAKAAGIEIDEIIDVDSDSFAGFMIRGTRCWWNTLTSDGDAFRLAVKLKMDLNFFSDEVACFGKLGLVESSGVIYGDDSYAATRRAITRAAAEIGRAATQ